MCVPRENGLFILFSSDHYSVLQTTQQLVIGLDLCSTAITFKYLKRKLSEHFGEIPSEELIVALTDAYEGGFISIDGMYNSRKLKRNSDNSVRPSNVNDIHIQITDRCNYNCIYCYNRNVRKKLNKELSTDEWKNIFDKLAEYKPSKYVFSGGEPLLRDDIAELSKYIRELPNTSVSLITNGSLVNAANAATLAEVFDDIAVSIDSHEENISDSLRCKGAYRAANRALELLDRYNIKLSLNVCLTGLNIQEFENTSEYYLEKYKNVYSINLMKLDFDELCPEISISNAQLLNFVDERYKRIHENSKYGTNLRNESIISPRNGCGVGGSQITIGPDGSVYPCHLLYSPEFNCGNLQEESFEKIFNESDILTKFRQADRNRSNQCKNNDCHFFFYCNGGCLAMTFYKTGELKPWCTDRDCQYFQKESFERIALQVERGGT